MVCICLLSAHGFDKCNCEQINTGSSLESLGTLVAGVPSDTIEKIPSSELLTISQNATFVSNIQAAPTVVQQTVVKKVQSLLLIPPQHVHSWLWTQQLNHL